MIKRRPSLTENKLLLMYSIDALGPVNNQQALRFVIENDIMDYIDLQLSLAELTDVGFLIKINDETGTLFDLSADGRDALGMFLKRVPYSRREHVLNISQQWRARFRRERQVLYRWERTLQRDYLATLSVVEGGQHIMDVSVRVPGLEQAKLVCYQWEAHAEDIYATLMRMLSDPDAFSGGMASPLYDAPEFDTGDVPGDEDIASDMPDGFGEDFYDAHATDDISKDDISIDDISEDIPGDENADSPPLD